MKILPNNITTADAKKMRRRGELGFTMVEIAIAIGVIGFALVAIIGILPRGMKAQRDTRGYTIISQDAAYFLDAIRNGAAISNGNAVYPTAQGLDFLTNYVQSIRFDYISGSNTYATPVMYTNMANGNNWGVYTNGAEIIGLLCTPQTNYYNTNTFPSKFFDITATVRALSGPATEQNGLNGMMAFTYRMEVMVTPFSSIALEATNYNEANLDVNQSNICYNRWLQANPGAQGTATAPISTPGGTVWVPAGGPAYSGALVYNMFNVRLRFSWPVLANGTTGDGHQTYCTVVGSQLVNCASADGVPCWFFQPQTFANGMPQSGL